MLKIKIDIPGNIQKKLLRLGDDIRKNIASVLRDGTTKLLKAHPALKPLARDMNAYDRLARKHGLLSLGDHIGAVSPRPARPAHR